MKKSLKVLVLVAVLSSMFAVTGCENGSSGSDETGQTNLNYSSSSKSNGWEVVKGDPRINLETMPNMNQEGIISGKIRIANPETYFVAMYEKISDTWVREPYADYDIVVKTGGGFNVPVKASSCGLVTIVALPKGRIAPATIGGTKLSDEFSLDAYITIKR